MILFLNLKTKVKLIDRNMFEIIESGRKHQFKVNN